MEIVPTIVMIFIIALFFIFFIIPKEKEKKERRKAEDFIRRLEEDGLKEIGDLVLENFDRLFTLYQQKIYINEFGVYNELNIEKMFNEFITLLSHKIPHNIFISRFLHADKRQEKKDTKNYLTYVVKSSFEEICKQKKINPYDKPKKNKKIIKTGEDYEKFIAEELIELGFIIQRTKTTGDQGVDLIATKDNRSIAIQCKHYKKMVGNKAIQEIKAGKEFYNCDYACVITNSTYTVSARQLAHSCDVTLIDSNSVEELLEVLN